MVVMHATYFGITSSAQLTKLERLVSILGNHTSLEALTFAGGGMPVNVQPRKLDGEQFAIDVFPANGSTLGHILFHSTGTDGENRELSVIRASQEVEDIVIIIPFLNEISCWT